MHDCFRFYWCHTGWYQASRLSQYLGNVSLTGSVAFICFETRMFQEYWNLWVFLPNSDCFGYKWQHFNKRCGFDKFWNSCCWNILELFFRFVKTTKSETFVHFWDSCRCLMLLLLTAVTQSAGGQLKGWRHCALLHAALVSGDGKRLTCLRICETFRQIEEFCTSIRFVSHFSSVQVFGIASDKCWCVTMQIICKPIFKSFFFLKMKDVFV